jgi:hypothetical protein
MQHQDLVPRALGKAASAILKIKKLVPRWPRRDGKKEIEPPHVNELHVVFGMFRDFLPSRLSSLVQAEMGGNGMRLKEYSSSMLY